MLPARTWRTHVPPQEQYSSALRIHQQPGQMCTVRANVHNASARMLGAVADQGVQSQCQLPSHFVPPLLPGNLTDASDKTC